MKCLPLIAKLVFSWHVLKKSVLTAGTAENQIPKFRITNAKLYVPVVTLSTQDKIKLLKQFESGFKRTINWNKYKFNKTSSKQIFRYFNWCKFSRSKLHFVLSFEDDDDRKSYKQYYFQLWK